MAKKTFFHVSRFFFWFEIDKTGFLVSEETEDWGGNERSDQYFDYITMHKRVELCQVNVMVGEKTKNSF